MVAENVSITSAEFNTKALELKAEKEKSFEQWIKDGNLEKGANRDWEYTHIVWKQNPPEDKKGKTLPEEEWNRMLLDPGVFKICGFFGVRPKHIDEKVTIDREKGVVEVMMKAELRTILPILYENPRTGETKEIYPVIAEGVGACTTQEKRYKVKWENYNGRGLIAAGFTERDLQDIKKQHPDRLISDDPDIKKCIFYMPDPDAQGALNTLLKMAAKRAEMDAVFQIPEVAQRFSQELDVTDTSLNQEGDRVVTPPAPEEPAPGPSQQQDWDESLSSKIEAKWCLTPKQQRELCRQIMDQSDGLVTRYRAALSVLKIRLEKQDEKEAEEQMPPEQGFTPANQDKPEPMPDEPVGEEPVPEEESRKVSDFVTEEGVEKRKQDQLLYDIESVLENTDAGLDNLDIKEVEGGFNVYPKKFLGDLWQEVMDELKKLFNVSWVRDGKESHWEIRR